MSTLSSEVAHPSVAIEAPLFEAPETVIRPRRGWIAVDWKELWRHRELLYFLVWRDVKVRYKQAVLGIAWAVLAPVITVALFTLIFGRGVGSNSVEIPGSAATVTYRDLRFLIPFITQLGMWVSCVPLPVDRIVPEKWQWILIFNPLFGIFDAYRSAILGLPWRPWHLTSAVFFSVVILILG